MDARKRLWAVSLAALVSLAARYQTPNFLVTAPSREMAQQVGEAAEVYRREIAREWLGYVMPQWNQCCPVKVHLSGGAGGVTTFRFANGHVFGWSMSVQGPLDQILDSVLPHEVTHTVFASHFRRPLPRWADEGACTTVEHQRERAKQNRMLINFIRNGRGYAFRHLFRIREYPHDPQSMLSLYAHGHSVATYLLGKGGKRRFLNFINDGMQNEDWSSATEKHYGFENLNALQSAWMDWVRQGSPGIDWDMTSIASRGPAKQPRDRVIFRGQSEDPVGVATGRLAPVRSVSAQMSEARSDVAEARSDVAEARSDVAEARSDVADEHSEPVPPRTVPESPPPATGGAESGWRRPRRRREAREYQESKLAAGDLPSANTTAKPLSGFEIVPAAARPARLIGRHLPDQPAPPRRRAPRVAPPPAICIGGS